MTQRRCHLLLSWAAGVFLDDAGGGWGTPARGIDFGVPKNLNELLRRRLLTGKSPESGVEHEHCTEIMFSTDAGKGRNTADTLSFYSNSD